MQYLHYDQIARQSLDIRHHHQQQHYNHTASFGGASMSYGGGGGGGNGSNMSSTASLQHQHNQHWLQNIGLTGAGGMPLMQGASSSSSPTSSPGPAAAGQTAAAGGGVGGRGLGGCGINHTAFLPPRHSVDLGALARQQQQQQQHLQQQLYLNNNSQYPAVPYDPSAALSLEAALAAALATDSSNSIDLYNAAAAAVAAGNGNGNAGNCNNSYPMHPASSASSLQSLQSLYSSSDVDGVRRSMEGGHLFSGNPYSTHHQQQQQQTANRLSNDVSRASFDAAYGYLMANNNNKSKDSKMEGYSSGELDIETSSAVATAAAGIALAAQSSFFAPSSTPVAAPSTNSKSPPPPTGGGGGIHRVMSDRMLARIDETKAVSRLSEDDMAKVNGSGSSSSHDGAAKESEIGEAVVVVNKEGLPKLPSLDNLLVG